MVSADVLAVVPARGGSVGLPGKNLAVFRGRPLVAHAVHTALKAGLADVVVTTDDDDIAAAARTEGARVVRRPAALATADSRTLPAVLHVLDVESTPDTTVVVLLQPTSPLRTVADVEECLSLHDDRPTGSVVQMTTEPGHHPLKSCLVVDGTVQPVRAWEDLESPRQQLPVAARPTGGLYLARARDLRSWGRFFVPEVRAQFVPPERALDVDTEDDLHRAREWAARRA
ncbi:N-acylneuraminate cytidylyltransferase [Amycolatopsis arida]|uniref:N-acylneuraminate cytidylyltransferase n=1 Tax=Amycolatopsis arida TaxID=587909 RepID=A0A1I5YIP2_9PSEU|nr:acylneuraminate cytidylyltransferase family protein [Amycolatopsis arida]TDX90543.1 N-acylneuraminate cytidylyltransferase [Amycolatopsis arida]SFQ44084.1 N-acylneuraminate cytidylyltransferase [Amycolatopsis arida]